MSRVRSTFSEYICVRVRLLYNVNRATVNIGIAIAATVTASNIGRVVKRKAAVSEAFLTSIFKPKRFMSKATTYGTTTESLARRQYDSI